MSVIAPPHVHTHSHCTAHHEPDQENICMRVLEQVSAVALAIFSAFTDLALFVPFFLIGVGIAFYQRFSGQSAEALGGGAGGCSQGLLEQLTQTKLPPLVSLGANLAVTWCHIDHHSSVFVPIVALSTGAWVGRLIAQIV